MSTSDLSLTAATLSVTSTADLQTFETGLLTFIGQRGLPTSGVLVPISERAKVFSNIEDTLTLLVGEYRARSVYISKFIAAAASGLFDAALNYLWDETVAELRKRVVRYDLEYFYDIAVTTPEKRKKLSTEEQLVELDDNELIRGASGLGLISELGYKHLDFIRYMRNWASAAHPNQNQITGLQLVTWLETCIKEVIALPETGIGVQIKMLLANIKSHALNPASASQVTGFFVDLTPDQASTLMAGFFGLYTNENTLPQSRDNINLLAPTLWPFVNEAMRGNLGTKYGQFTANNDAPRAQWARAFLNLVGASAYIPDSIRMAELGTALDELLTVHHGLNNFYIEPSFASRLEALVGDKGYIPTGITEKYVETLVEVFLTNGHGVSWAADAIYLRLIAKLSSTQALLAVLSFRKVQISSKLQFVLCAKKYMDMVALAKQKIASPQGADIIAAVQAYKAPLNYMRSETVLMNKVSAITQSLGF